MNNIQRKFEYCSAFLFIWATVIIQFYFEDRYFNMLQAKAHIYLIGAAIGACLIVYAAVSHISQAPCDADISHTLRGLISRNSHYSRLNTLDIGIISYGVIALISSMLSVDIMISLTGLCGWGAGGLAIAAFALFYVVLSRNLHMNRTLWIIFTGACMVILIIGILNSMGIDVINLHGGIRRDQYFWYISTVGNMNWFVGYLCLVVPVFAVFFIQSGRGLSYWIFLIIMAVCCLSMVLSACDGLYLGILTCIFPAIPYLLGSRKRLQRTGVLVTLYGLSLLTVKFCPAFARKATTYSGVSDAILSHPFIGIMLVLIGTALHASLVTGRFTFRAKSGRHAIILSESALLIFAIIMVIRSAMTFDDSWGTERGLIWTYYVEAFMDFDFVQKLFGVGPEMLYFYSDQLISHFEMAVTSAHSSFVQALLTTGIAGLCSCLFICICVVVMFFRRRIWETAGIPFFMAVSAFIGQSMVYSVQAANLSLLCVMLALTKVFMDSPVAENTLFMKGDSK